MKTLALLLIPATAAAALLLSCQGNPRKARAVERREAYEAQKPPVMRAPEIPAPEPPPVQPAPKTKAQEIVEWRENYVSQHPELSDRHKQLIIEGRFASGMSVDDALAAWNHTRSMVTIHETVGTWGRHEQVVIRERVRNPVYLYFDDGKLTSYQITH